MRIALLTYRGNMYCGGQGIYAACLAREWQRAGHDVHVIAGPPLPELEPGIPLHVIPNENVFGHEHPDWLPKDDPFSLLKPLSLWELGVSRFGVFPEMETVRVYAPGYALAEVPVPAAGQLRVELTASNHLEVRVLDLDGQPLDRLGERQSSRVHDKGNHIAMRAAAKAMIIVVKYKKTWSKS